ncbi:MAG TPA: hypothetical protein VIV59_03430 [Anaeromyxobacteraceae bacterium]
MAPAVLCAALLAAVPAPPEDDQGERPVRIEADAGPGFDSNPLRVAGGGAPGADAFLAGAVRLGGGAGLDGGRLQLGASLSEGWRLFLRQRGADLLASRLEARARCVPWDGGRLGADLALKDLSERAGVRSQHEARAQLSAGLQSGEVDLGVGAGWAAVVPRNASLRGFRRDGPVGALWTSWRPVRAHVLSGRYEVARWSHPHWPAGREDWTHTAGLDLTWKGPALATLGYTFGYNRSSEPAATWRRHRLAASVAAFLPLDFTLVGEASVQWARHPAGVFLAEQILLGDAAENQNAVVLQLVRQIGPGLELSLGAASFGNELGGEAGVAFRRTVAQLLLRWEMEATSPPGAP